MKNIIRIFICCILLSPMFCLRAGAQQADIDSSQLNDRPSDINILQALAGKAAGVQVISTSGRPGGNPLLLVRGVGSIDGSCQPLYVVDGAEGVDPQSINTEDIDNIVVLKDGAATAIYGMRGANGVVLITTKDGRKSRESGNLSYSGSVGVSLLTSRPALLTSSQYMDMQQRAYDFSGTPVPHIDNLIDYKVEDAELKMIPKYDTDWWAESTRKATVNRHDIAFAQHNDNSAVYANLLWQDVRGVLSGTGASRLAGTVNASTKVNRVLDIRALVSYSRTKELLPDGEGCDFGALGMIYRTPALIPVKYEDGTWGAAGDFPLSADGSNPVHQLSSLKNTSTNDYFLGNIGLDLHLSSELTLSVSGNYRTVNFKNTDFRPADIYYWSDEETGNHAYITYSDSWDWAGDGHLDWRHSFANGALQSEFTAGGAFYSSSYYSNRVGAQQMSTALFEHYNLGAGTQRIRPESDQYDYSLWSVYARTTQTLLGRYSLTAGIRRDSCPRFEDETLKSGIFPFAAAKWTVSGESWMAATRDIIKELDLHASYGTGGNLTWRTNVWDHTTGIDAGLEASLNFAGLWIGADYYSKTTICRPEAGCVLKNSGIELSLGARPVERSRFVWDVNAIYYTNNCRMAAWEGDMANHGGALQAGEQLARWKTVRNNGTWQVSEIADAVVAGSRPGNYKYGEEEYFGSVFPKGNAELVNNFNFAGFNLYVDLAAAWGFYVANMTKASLISNATGTNSLAAVLGDSWTTDNQDAKYARLRLPSDDGFADELGSLALERGDYLRLRTVALSYDLKRTLLKNFAPLQGILAGITIDNPFVLTGYSGYDPEVGSAASWTGLGYDLYAYPRPMTITGNIKLTF